MDEAGVAIELFLHFLRLGGTLRKNRRGRGTSVQHGSDTVVQRIEEGMARLYYFALLLGPGGLYYHVFTRTEAGRHCFSR